MKSASATFNFLGNLVEAVPDEARRLATQYGEFSFTQELVGASWRTCSIRNTLRGAGGGGGRHYFQNRLRDEPVFVSFSGHKGEFPLHLLADDD